MTDKDLKDMTASELLRWAANGEPYSNGLDDHTWNNPTGKIKALAEAVTGEWPVDLEAFSHIADKIDAEIEAARELSLLQGAAIWAKANGWPDIRDGESFGAWLDRCAVPRPRFEDGEPVQFGDEVELHYKSGGCDKGRMQSFHPNSGPAWILSFVGCDHERLYRYDSECDVLKRPAPEVLGADGLPIKVGETVYDIYRGDPIVVKGISRDSDGNPVVRGESNEIAMPHLLTHIPPETQERIDNDVQKTMSEYWECVSFCCSDCPARINGKTPDDRYSAAGCDDAMKFDLLRRQRELDARKGGAE